MIRTSFFVALTCVCLMSSRAPASPLSVTAVTLGGIINQDSDDTPAFTPDGDTVFFDRSEGPKKTIMVSHRIKGHWSSPQPASFSGRWFDQDPVVAPDGSFLLFNSDRPVSAGGKPLVQNYFAGGPGPGSNLWRVDRIGDRWGDPVWLRDTINSDVFIDFASLASDGTLYFMRWNAGEKSMHLWASRYQHGSYLAPQFVTLGDPKESIHDPAVAPDQSFIVFDSGKVKGGWAACASRSVRESTGARPSISAVGSTMTYPGAHILGPIGARSTSPVRTVSIGFLLRHGSTRIGRRRVLRLAHSPAAHAAAAHWPPKHRITCLRTPPNHPLEEAECIVHGDSSGARYRARHAPWRRRLE